MYDASRRAKRRFERARRKKRVAIFGGFLKLVRRASGSTVGALLAPWRASLEADVHLGLADTEHGRCAQIIGPNRPWRIRAVSPTHHRPSAVSAPTNASVRHALEFLEDGEYALGTLLMRLE